MITIDTFKRGIRSGKKTLFSLLKFMVPMYIFVQILSISGLLNTIAIFFSPVMSVFGLPGEASLAIIVGYFVSMSGSLGTIASINLNDVQATTIAIMVSLAHNLFAESAIIKKMGVSGLLSACIRILFSFICGFIFYRIFR